MAIYAEEDVLALAGERSFGRGVSYVDAVESLESDDTTVYATVQGSELYEIRLRIGRHGLDGECNCPWGEEGNFCKHCVAVALVYLHEQEHGSEAPRRVDLRRYLETLDRGELVGLVMEAAEADRGLRRRLVARALSDPAGGADETGSASLD